MFLDKFVFGRSTWRLITLLAATAAATVLGREFFGEPEAPPRPRKPTTPRGSKAKATRVDAQAGNGGARTAH